MGSVMTGSVFPTRGRSLSPGVAEGTVLRLDEPLSFWGGLDSETGLIIDRRHPQVGANLAGVILVMERGRGSSSGSSVLAEAIRNGTAPAAIVMAADDEIVALGAIVADEIYQIRAPVVVVGKDKHDNLRDGMLLRVVGEEMGDAVVEPLR
jgi:predicted aconitase with swiveling domain